MHSYISSSMYESKRGSIECEEPQSDYNRIVGTNDEIAAIVAFHTDAIQKIKDDIREPIRLDNYLCVLINILYLCELYMGNYVSVTYKLSLADSLLKNMGEFDPLYDMHKTLGNQIYKISAKRHKLIGLSNVYGDKTPLFSWFSVIVVCTGILFENVIVIGALFYVMNK